MTTEGRLVRLWKHLNRPFNWAVSTEERLDRWGNHLKLRALLPSSDILLLAVGILLVGAAVAVAVWTVSRWNSYRHGNLSAESVAAYGFVCAVIGLSGLVCAVLGLVRLLARKKRNLT